MTCCCSNATGQSRWQCCRGMSTYS